MLSPQEFKVRDSQSYDVVADAFDRYTDRFTTPVARRVAALANIHRGARVLDIGTGTGIVALEAGLLATPGGLVLGIDLSEGLVDIAIRKTRRAGMQETVRYELMDAEQLEIRDGSFDTVVSLFALLHLPDPLRALREMYRVLRPGGALVIAVGSGAPFPSLDGVRHGLHLIPEWLACWRGKRLLAPDFLNELVRKHIPAETDSEQTAMATKSRNQSRSVPALVREAGFTEVVRSWKGYEATLASTEEFLEMQQTYSSLARKRLLSASVTQQAAVRTEFVKHCSKVLARGGRLIYRYAALFVTARRP